MKKNSTDYVSKCGEKQKKKFPQKHDIKHSKPKPKKRPNLKNHFQLHFNLGHTNLKMSKEIEYASECFQTLQYLSLNLNNNEPSDEEFEKAIKN